MLRKLLLASLPALLLIAMLPGAEAPQADRRAAAVKLSNDGNYRDAFEEFRKLALDPDTDPKQVGSDLQLAISSLQQLGRTDEIDELLEQTIELHKENWRLLSAAGQSYVNQAHYGYMVAGKFYRGDKRGGGEMVSSLERDRLRALQLLNSAMTLAEKAQPAADGSELSRLYEQFATTILSARGYDDAWELQVLTDISKLPDYEPGGYWWRGRESRGAPVDENGNPVFYHVPESFAASVNDGERWRWLLDRAMQADKSREGEVLIRYAAFLRNQFGVQTMQEFGWFFASQDDQSKKDESGPYALESLGENETIAKLATGIKRFPLPDEFNYIRVYKKIAELGQQPWAELSLGTLAEIFEDRRQYSKAADYWRASIEKYGPGNNNFKRDRLNQIIGNWGRFEMVQVQPAGKGATVEFRYRNAQDVTFEAHRVKFDKLLDDVKAYLKSNPAQLAWEKLNIDNIGYRLVEQNEQQYVGERVATWQQKLEPAAGHLDQRITITTPLEGAGVYLLTAKLADGNTSRIIIWLSDTVIAQKPLNGKTLYYVADAVTGRPIEKAHAEFFGYRQENRGRNRLVLKTSQFAEYSDANGQIVADPKQQSNQFSWIVVAKTKDGRFAHLGFNNVWYGEQHDAVYDQNKAFVITDRPVYRPDQPVKFKFWIRNARYDEEDTSKFAKQKFTVRITNPQGETALEKEFESDEYGGFDGEYALSAETMLGQYGIHLINRDDISGGGSFRVEEYKKPEFEVTVDAPSEPVQLGDTITATVNAKYYFGAPVVNASVHYKVTRSSYTTRWFPIGRWDWLYGSGYWWFAYDYEWFPGWTKWGCIRPAPLWWPSRFDPPEVVLDNEVPIGPDGTVKIAIDTSLAKAMHADTDHRYEITAEVVDQSRRTIVGTGEVLVARQPFKVFAWVNRGHYRAGDTIHAYFKAQTLDQKPVQGKGRLVLYRVTYNESEPVEAEVETWDLDTNAQGDADLQIKPQQPGQYRLAYQVTDAKNNTIEGGYVFNVVGEDFDGSQFRFNDIELITDKREYQPGETVRVMVNTNRVGSTVLLFVRAENGIYPEPKVIRLDGKSTIHDVAVVQKDMPNFFIEALTVSGGKVHSEVRDVVVPPEQRVASVEVLPSQAEYKPGEDAKIKLRLLDVLGKPFVGSTVVAVYDKSVEYISGGSNVPEIREFFWKFRRSHHPITISNVDRYSDNVIKNGETPMNNLGAFGEMIFDREVQLGQKMRRKGDRIQTFGMQAEGAMPAAAPAMEGKVPALVGDSSGGGGSPVVQPTVRKEFADTAYWAAAITADKDGYAEVAVKMPENLTTWKVRAWSLGNGTRVGQGDAEVITTKNLLVRLQAPRFFTETDEVVLTANVHNYLTSAKSAHVILEVEGGTLELMEGSSAEQVVEVAADGEAVVNWRVKAVAPGTAIVRMKALTDEESDAVEMKFPVQIHGMLKTESFTGTIRPDANSAKFTVNVPSERNAEQTAFEIRYSPTLAGALVDALPYLGSYPHDTTDCTVNRFVPTVIVQNILLRMNLNLKDIQEKRTNLNAQEIGDDQQRAAGWKRYKHNPVFDQDEVARMVKQGVQALTEMQLADGGWGWFSGWGEHSDAHTTAIVVHGLQLAVENDVALVPNVLERGVAWLKNYQDTQVQLLKNGEPEKPKEPYKTQATNIDAFVYMVLVDAGQIDADMQRFLYRDRTHLSVYAKGLFGLALHKQGAAEQLAMIVQNIDQFLVQDEENQTAYLKMPEGSFWWFWYDSETEANAYYLKLLSRIDPKSEKAPRLVKYLLNNRKNATYWSSTRDTAIAVEALAEYLKASGEAAPNLTVEILIDGTSAKKVQINTENLFSFDNKLLLEGDAVSSGEHTVELRKSGTGPLYWNAYLTNFTKEEFIAAAGLELKVNRKYYKLIREDENINVAGSRGQAVGQRVEKYRREELSNLAELKSGDQIEIELEIDSKNDYEYLVFDDMKAAGFEPISVQSGYGGNALGAYMELRDERVSFFVRRLARGKHSVAFRLMAEIPGKFSALPAKGSGMYAPELRANSDEIKLTIVE